MNLNMFYTSIKSIKPIILISFNVQFDKKEFVNNRK